MSRGFVKEDDQEEVPMVPKRAYLPQGIPNFVTPTGMEQLVSEKQALLKDKNDVNQSGENENEKRIALNHLNAKLQLLNNRIAEARIVNPNEQPEDEIRFSATVALKNTLTLQIQTLQIVGVDEADISKGKISFISPMARLLINKKNGDKVVLKREGKDTTFEITGISYR
jgi:transcription elongation factor GreB